MMARAIGWEVLHTYQGAVGAEYIKSVVDPIREVAPMQSLHGFWNKYNVIQADVLYVVGEIHEDRKPVCISSLSFGAA
jgi:hypothetical protein